MIRVYRWLLYLYPPSFRRAHGQEMQQFVRAAAREHGFAVRLAFDLLRSVAREWVDVLTTRSRSSDALPQRRASGDPMTTLLADVRYAVRWLARSPGFVTAAVLTLALGIGVNTAVFSIAERVLLEPIKVASPEELVSWTWTSAYPDYVEYTKRSDVFTGVMATSGSRVSISADDSSELRSALFVSGNAFDVLGVPPASGRALQPADDVPNAPIVGMLSHDYWTTRFGRSASAVGRMLRVNGRPVTIIGVAPRQFRGTTLSANPALYLPLTSVPQIWTGFFSRVDVLNARGFVWLNVIGRLQPGVTLAQASKAVDTLYRELHPPTPGAKPEPLRLEPMPVRALGASGPALERFVALLIGVVVLTLLIGCANLANLLLAKGAARNREVGLRLALGATRAAILRQMLIESVLLAVLGGTGGLLVASMSLDLLATFQLPGSVAIEDLGLRLNGAALAAAAALSLATGLLFGIAPAWRASRGDLMTALRAGARTGGTRNNLRGTLVAAQVALSLALLAGSGLFLRSLVHALNVPLGFDVHRTATASVNLGLARFDEPRARAFYASALQRLHAHPLVASAAWTNMIPTRGIRTVQLQFEGYARRQDEDMSINVAQVGPRYFDAAGTRLVEGRAFTTADTAAAPRVAIVNEAAAATYFGGRALGRGVRVWSEEARWATIVGVVETTKVRQLNEKPIPYVYFPFDQPTERDMTTLDTAHLVVRTHGDGDALVSVLAGELRAIDAAAPVYDVKPLAEHVRELAMPQRMGVTLFGFFSLLALTLATVGIYGVASYVAALRTREIGIRMALGADRSAIGRLVLRQGAVPVVAGIAAGLCLAFWTGHLAAMFLYDVNPSDPMTFGTVCMLLALVALVALYVPARRAARLDPVAALRHD